MYIFVNLSGRNFAGQAWCFLCWWSRWHHMQVQELGYAAATSWTILWCALFIHTLSASVL